jgi:hypothetical protein
LEINLNRRTLAQGVILIILLLAGFFFLHQIRPGGNPPLADDALAPTHTPPPQTVAGSDLAIDFVNQSAWQVNGVDACLPELSVWLESRYPIRKLTIVVTDAESEKMALAVRQSGENGAPDAEVAGKCTAAKANELTCSIVIKEGDPSPNLDVAATVELAWLLREFYRPKTRDAWNKLQSDKDGLESYQPLISKEGGRWRSNCLHLTR